MPAGKLPDSIDSVRLGVTLVSVGQFQSVFGPRETVTPSRSWPLLLTPGCSQGSMDCSRHLPTLSGLELQCLPALRSLWYLHSAPSPVVAVLCQTSLCTQPTLHLKTQGKSGTNSWGPPLLSLLLARLSPTISNPCNFGICSFSLARWWPRPGAPLCAVVWEVAPGRKLGLMWDPLSMLPFSQGPQVCSVYCSMFGNRCLIYFVCPIAVYSGKPSTILWLEAKVQTSTQGMLRGSVSSHGKRF